MFSLKEIPLQNRQECWPLLFSLLSRSVCDTFGAEGESLIRATVRSLGQHLGSSARETLCSNGEKANLKQCALHGAVYPFDPRFRGALVRCSEQELLWEIYTCPMASLWALEDSLSLGRFFCEEYSRAYFAAFSEGCAYVNQSDFLTNPKDNHCRFAVYYRPANLPPDKRSAVFSEHNSAGTGYYGENALAKQFWLRLFSAFYSCLSQLGPQGLTALTCGLSLLAEKQAAVTAAHAKALGALPDRAFIAEHFVLSAEDMEALAQQELSAAEAQILYEHFSQPFLAALDRISKKEVL